MTQVSSLNFDVSTFILKFYKSMLILFISWVPFFFKFLRLHFHPWILLTLFLSLNYVCHFYHWMLMTPLSFLNLDDPLSSLHFAKQFYRWILMCPVSCKNFDDHLKPWVVMTPFILEFWWPHIILIFCWPLFILEF